MGKPFSVPERKVSTYSSSNPQVVSISETGRLLAGKDGQAVITITAAGEKSEVAVEVTGVESSPVNEEMNSTTTPATTAPGDVKGGAKAKVQTSAKADIVVKQLNVSAVRSVADTCTMQK